METNDMIKPEHATIADRYVGKECKLYTLDGIKDATISGRLCRFAMIRSLDGSCGAQFSWAVVARKMGEGDKIFHLC